MTPHQIKRQLKAKKLTQAKLARRFGVSQTAIAFLIQRKVNSRRLDRRLARVLGITLDEFYGNGKAEAVNE